MSEFADLQAVVEADAFPEVDIALRSGRHLDRDDGELYAFVVDAAPHLERFYRRYGCELCHRPDGYYFLVPVSDKLGRRHLTATEMVAGQALALLFLDPSTLSPEGRPLEGAEAGAEAFMAPARAGVVTHATLVGHLANLLGRDALLRLFNPGKKRLDERVAEEQVRARLREGVRKLAALGFVRLVEDDGILLRPALMRFADPVRGAGNPRAALEHLVASGEMVVTDDEGTGASLASEESADDDAASEAEREGEEAPLEASRDEGEAGSADASGVDAPVDAGEAAGRDEGEAGSADASGVDGPVGASQADEPPRP